MGRVGWFILFLVGGFAAPTLVVYGVFFGVGLIVGVANPAALDNVSDDTLNGLATALGLIVAMSLMAFAASKVDMTPLWALGLFVPIFGTVGVVRVCWRHATVRAEGFNPYEGYSPLSNPGSQSVEISEVERLSRRRS